ncbi:hypothetical protein WCLP8_5250015 [uncultured Gammaproteobacteria bacterium]
MGVPPVATSRPTGSIQPLPVFRMNLWANSTGNSHITAFALTVFGLWAVGTAASHWLGYYN